MVVEVEPKGFNMPLTLAIMKHETLSILVNSIFESSVGSRKECMPDQALICLPGKLYSDFCKYHGNTCSCWAFSWPLYGNTNINERHCPMTS